MATSKDYADGVMERLSCLDGVTRKSMFGEYGIYWRGKLVAYMCDDRTLVKPTATAESMLPGARREPPYEGAKPMLVVDGADSGDVLAEIVVAVYDELPAPKKRRSNGVGIRDGFKYN